MSFIGGPPMKPNQRSETLLGVTRSKAKMYEYGIAAEYHIEVRGEPAQLFTLALASLGDLAARVNTSPDATATPDFPSLRDDLRFTAHFLDAFREAKFDQALDPYTLLLGSAAYYLCDLPGSAAVLARRLPTPLPDLGGSGLEALMAWLLRGQYSDPLDAPEGHFHSSILALATWLREYSAHGSDEAGITGITTLLRKRAYDNGTARQLLFADVVSALARRRRDSSAWYSLPKYSHNSTDVWRSTLQKDTFIRELWPAQRLLGEAGLLRGKSGIVQMPTSAGKTRATDLIIRSEFLANRTDLAVIVAPFRALCHEIRESLIRAFRNEPVTIDEFSDVSQGDFDIQAVLHGKHILVLTPEKLVYILRHNPELAPKIGLLIYDEGHQFDNGIRGVTFELLVTSLKTLIPATAQTILVSAVIQNADAINQWLNGADAVVVVAKDLGPTYRSIAFASWTTSLGRLQFVAANNPEKTEFFVPRLLEQFELTRKPRERSPRIFPEKTDGGAIALYLGLKLVPSGSVAVFCGTKLTAAAVCELAVDCFDRGLQMSRPVELSDHDEVQRLCTLHEQNLGQAASVTIAAKLGIFAHHGNMPHGLRLAIEHAMKEGLIRFVVCTSTLAQGVNLPIRYLIVSSTNQGADQIKVRDFHNLIGRAGRSGMHTEGTILFANPEVFDNRQATSGRDAGRWQRAKHLLDPANAEPCASTLLSVLDPLSSDDRRVMWALDPVRVARAYVKADFDVDRFVGELAQEVPGTRFSGEGIARQVRSKLRVLEAVESYLMTYWDSSDDGQKTERVDGLARRTLAYYLAGDEIGRRSIVALFQILAQNLDVRLPQTEKRQVFGRTLFGVGDVTAIETWVSENRDQIGQCETADDQLRVIWPLFSRFIRNDNFRKCNPPEILAEFTRGWLSGQPFHQLLALLSTAEVRFGTGKGSRHVRLDHVVELCENALGFDGMLVVGAIAEIVENQPAGDQRAADNLRSLQKRLKYGLSTATEIAVFELGLSDRVIAIEVAKLIGLAPSRGTAARGIRRNSEQVRTTMQRYPVYYQRILRRIIR
jgi:POLQ-like helicase